MWLNDQQLMIATLPELLEWLASSHSGRRSQAARELVNRKQQPEVVWPVLLAVPTDDCWSVRLQVVRGAFHLGMPIEQTIPILQELLTDPDEIVQSYTAWVLEQFGQGNQADRLEELVRQGKRKTIP